MKNDSKNERLRHWDYIYNYLTLYIRTNSSSLHHPVHRKLLTVRQLQPGQPLEPHIIAAPAAAFQGRRRNVPAAPLLLALFVNKLNDRKSRKVENEQIYEDKQRNDTNDKTTRVQTTIKMKRRKTTSNKKNKGLQRLKELYHNKLQMENTI